MKTAICAIIKDEHLFLEEWIEWHLNLGFNAIHLFEDKGSKSHEEICEKYNNVYLRRYEDDVEVQEMLAEQGSARRQFVLYEWFGNSYKGKYDWVAFIDIDEFISFNTDYSLEKLCSEYKCYPAVLLYWKMMGASNLVKRPDSIVKYYTKEVPIPKNEVMWAHKVICNLHKWSGMATLHRTTDYVNTNYNKGLADYCYDKAWINHYFTKSWEDWCDRIFKRGGTQIAHRLLSDFFDINPDMEYLREELVSKVVHRIPKGTYWIDKKRRIIAGGNVSKINDLNKKCYDSRNT